MASLVYHPLDAEAGELSPFVERILAIAEGSDLCIVSPYVGLSVLKHVTTSAASWRLLTDVEALLTSQPPCNRADWSKVFADPKHRIRHWPGVHAKVVIGDRAALLGSANITMRGLGRRQEMAIALDQDELVGELRAWFESLWQRCEPATACELGAFIAALPPTPPVFPSGRLSSPAPEVRARVISQATTIENADDAEGRLRDRLAYAVTRHWAEAFLDMCAELLDAIEATSGDDPRVAMTLPRAGRVLRVNVFQREALSAFRRDRISIGMMLPADLTLPSPISERLLHRYTFSPTSSGQWFGYFKVDDPHALDAIRGDWLDTLHRETKRTQRRSSYHRHHHVPAFFRAVTDRPYRQRLLDSVFVKRAWWFGINNGSGGHMQLARCRAFFAGDDALMRWPVGHSKPKRLYAEMHPGDRALFWTGQGSEPSWGLVGSAEIAAVSSDEVVLRSAKLFPRPLTPYPKGAPAETEMVAFLLQTFGEEFEALGDVRRAVFGTVRRPPVTVAPVSIDALEAVLAKVAER